MIALYLWDFRSNWFMIWTRTRLIARLRCCTIWKRSRTILVHGKKQFSQVIVRTKHIHSNDFHLTTNGSIVAQKMITYDSLCSTFKNSDDIEIVKTLRNETHISLSEGILVPRHNLRKTRKIMIKVKVIEFSNDSWSWNGQLMCNISHRSLFNQLLLNFYWWEKFWRGSFSSNDSTWNSFSKKWFYWGYQLFQGKEF